MLTSNAFAPFLRVLVEPLCLFHPTWGYGSVGWVKRSGPTAVLTSNAFAPFMRVLVEPLCLCEDYGVKSHIPTFTGIRKAGTTERIEGKSRSRAIDHGIHGIHGKRQEEKMMFFNYFRVVSVFRGEKGIEDI